MRNRAVVELTIYAGLRAKEVASLRWEHLLDKSGEVGEVIRLTNDAPKGTSVSLIPLSSALNETLRQLRNVAARNGTDDPNSPVIASERGGAMKQQSVVNLLRAHYQRCDIKGGSSRSGRKTFITNVTCRILTAGGSMR